MVVCAMPAHHSYENFRYRMKWDADDVAGFSTVGGLNWTDEVVEHREGGDPATVSHPAGRTTYPALTLQRGITFDAEFQAWATRAWTSGSAVDADVALRDLRKDVIIDVYDEAGQLAVRYNVHRAWVSEYQALPDLDANANAVEIEHIKLEHEGLERDVAPASAVQ
jgi:phage tail-like protein